jgi:hypothetical protein
MDDQFQLYFDVLQTLERLTVPYINQWAHKLGKDAEHFWQTLKQLADSADKHHPTGAGG